MAGATKQQILKTVDGTDIVIDTRLKDGDSPVMSPGESNFIATCTTHGKLDEGYVSMLVGWEASDHANAHHGGLVSTADLLDLGPAIQL
jgi:hypothetical protein